MNKRTISLLVVFGVIIIAVIVLAALSNNQSTTKDDKLNVVATFYPLEEISSRVGGDKVRVNSVIPSGVEPHDYEPTPSDFARLNNADMFVTIGLEFSPIEEKLIESANKDLKVMDSKTGVELLSIASQVGVPPEEQETGTDPHVWVSPKNMIIMTKNVRDELMKVDPQNKDYYQNNAQEYISELTNLDKEFSQGLSYCDKDTVLVNHQAYEYMAKDYGFKQVAIYGISPEAEPSPGTIANLVNEARKYDIKYVLYESLVDPRVAETIAEEVGAQTLVLDPVEGITNPGDNYITIMDRNLINLKIALECN
jgi:zinc transport system substrate-binding protein